MQKNMLSTVKMGFKLSVNSNESKINFLRKNKKFGALNIHFFNQTQWVVFFFFEEI